MKKIIIATIILLSAYNMNAQKKGAFMRVFNNASSLINKGHLYSLTDNSLFLLNGKDTIEIMANKIGLIKLRRSFGHTLAVTASVSAVTFALIGAFTGQKKQDPTTLNGLILDLFTYTPAEGAGGGLVLGAATGAIAGSIIAGTRKRPTVSINNNLDKWKQAIIFLKSYLPLQNGTN